MKFVDLIESCGIPRKTNLSKRTTRIASFGASNSLKLYASIRNNCFLQKKHCSKFCNCAGWNILLFSLLQIPMNSFICSVMLPIFLFGSHLDDLPSELAAKMIQYLPDRDIRALACTSRLYPDLVRPIRNTRLDQISKLYRSLVERGVISTRDIFNKFTDLSIRIRTNISHHAKSICHTPFVQTLPFCRDPQTTFRFTFSNVTYLVIRATSSHSVVPTKSLFFVFNFQGGELVRASHLWNPLEEPRSDLWWNERPFLNLDQQAALQCFENLYQGKSVQAVTRFHPVYERYVRYDSRVPCTKLLWWQRIFKNGMRCPCGMVG